MQINSINKSFYTQKSLQVSTSFYGRYSSKLPQNDYFVLSKSLDKVDTNIPSLITKLTDFVSSVKEKISNKINPKIIIERKEGDAYKNISKTDNPVFAEAKQILNNIDCFDNNDLIQLSSEDKDKLRKSISTVYKNDKSIEKDANLYINETKKLKTQLQKMFPKGYSIVSIGSSPSVMSDILKLEGVDVKYLPFSSSLSRELFCFYKYEKDLRTLFNNSGITKDFVNTDKPKVFIDYTSSGDSLNAVRFYTYYLYGYGHNIKFMSLNKDFKIDPTFELNYMWFSNNGSFSFVLPMKNFSDVRPYNKHKLKFCPSITAKLMRFAILDKYNKL